MIVRPMGVEDVDAVLRIYGEGIASGNATFEVSTPTAAEFHARFLASCRLVADGDEGLVGWAALSAYSARPAYRGVAEVSVYVTSSARGRGVGSALLRALIACASGAGFWTLQAGVFPENVASLALHERCGFRVVGTRERIGRRDDVWRDVVLMELRME